MISSCKSEMLRWVPLRVCAVSRVGWVGGKSGLKLRSLMGSLVCTAFGDLYFNLDFAVVLDVVCEHFSYNFLAAFDICISFGRSFTCIL